MGGAVILGLVVLALFGIPWIKFILTTVSTDDAYVNGHVTFVAARVPGQVSKVLVDDNNRVTKGDLLVELDSEPYMVEVALKKAAVNTAKADLDAAKANVRQLSREIFKPWISDRASFRRYFSPECFRTRAARPTATTAAKGIIPAMPFGCG
jgi:membrane fusion protein (multidrug efflux system)